MAYTFSALFFASLILTVSMSNEINHQKTIEKESIAPENLKKAFSHTYSRYVIDSMKVYSKTVSTNATLQKRNSSEIEKEIMNLTESGMQNSKKKRNKTITKWVGNTLNLFNSLQNITYGKSEVDINKLSIRTQSRISFRTHYRNYSREINFSVKISNVPDPLFYNTSNSRNMTYCGYDSIAVNIYNKSNTKDYSGKARAKIETPPISYENSSDKILLSRNVTTYNKSNVANFDGYVSKIKPDNPKDYNENYLVGLNYLPELKQGNSVILYEGLWDSNFNRSIISNCYMSTNLNRAPSIHERLNNESEGDSEYGIYTITEPKQNISDAGFERLNNLKDNLTGIHTVTKPNSWENFKISEELAESEDIGPLLKN